MPDIMSKMDIAFPHLGIYIENLPKRFSVFGFEIAFYGVILGLSVLVGLLLVVREAKVTGQNPDLYWDFAMYAIFFSIVGSRLYYVAFTWEHYKDNLLSVFDLRSGGIAIYGTVIGGFTTLFIYAYIKKKMARQMIDTCVLGLLIGQIIGRWGNFMNREAFGGYTDNLLAMRLPIEAVRQSDISAELAAGIVDGTNYIQVHPTFLYESVLNLILFIAILCYRKHKKFMGEIGLLYFGGYGIIRFFVEGLRTDQLQFSRTGIAVSQILGLIMFIAALAAGVTIQVLIRKKPEWADKLSGMQSGEQNAKS